jgi:serine/threonine protein kinase
MKPASDLLRKEINIWCQLDHENVLNIKSLPVSTTIAIEMPYIDGLTVGEEQVVSLADLRKPIQEAFAVTIIRGVAQGIQYVHRQGVRHYHLKPSSILLTPTIIPKVSGFARGQGEFGAAHGESGYSAPELRDEETYGTPGMKTDVFLLSSLFYELLTGYPPFSSALYTLFPDIPKDALVPVSRIKQKLEIFEHFFDKTLSISKDDRYESVKEFIVALNGLYGWEEPPRKPVKIDDNIRAHLSKLARMGSPQHIVLPPLHEDLMGEYGDLTDLENNVPDGLLE